LPDQISAALVRRQKKHPENHKQLEKSWTCHG